MYTFSKLCNLSVIVMVGTLAQAFGFPEHLKHLFAFPRASLAAVARPIDEKKNNGKVKCTI